MIDTDKCDGCPFCSDPEILIEPHYLKDKSYTSSRIISRCLATEHKFIIGSTVAEMYCKRKAVQNGKAFDNHSRL